MSGARWAPVALVCAVLATVLVGATIGRIDLSLGDAVRVMLGRGTPAQETVLLHLRLPRLLIAAQPARGRLPTDDSGRLEIIQRRIRLLTGEASPSGEFRSGRRRTDQEQR